MTVSTIHDLALAVGRDARTVARWVRRQAWAFSRTGPWDTVAVRTWAARNIARYPPPAPAAAAPPAATADIRQIKLIQEARKLQLHNDQVAGLLHNTEECRQSRLRKLHAIKAGLLALARALGPDLVGQSDAVQIQTIVDRHVRRLLTAYAAGHDGQGAIPQDEDADHD